jgi:hypothetical protein
MLVECAQLVESKTDQAVKLLVKFKDSVSKNDDPVEQFGFYFAEGLCIRVIVVELDVKKNLDQTTSEIVYIMFFFFILYYFFK